MDPQNQDEEDFSRLALLLSIDNAQQTHVSVPQPPVPCTRPISKRRGKKRSSRACTTCRARKVRCNIVAHGAPCSNCRHDEIECILPLSRRQKYVDLWNYCFLLTNRTKDQHAKENRPREKRLGKCSLKNLSQQVLLHNPACKVIY